MSEVPDFCKMENQAYQLLGFRLWATAFGFEFQLDSKPLSLTLILVLCVTLPFRDSCLTQR